MVENRNEHRILDECRVQSDFSDPGKYAHLFDALPTDVAGMAEVVRNLVVHYRTPGIDFPNERLAEADLCWVERILENDQRRFGTALDVPRPQEDRTVGCCRDFTLLTIAALRHRGIPARSRIGFAAYLDEDFRTDHVIVEYHDGDRWIWMDAQLGMPDLGRDQFETAATAWLAYRRGEVDPENYGVSPDLPIRGAWFIRNYVIQELAHRRGDEMLLWDAWGAMSETIDGDPEDLVRVDRLAGLLVRADAGDVGAERALSELYSLDEQLQPGESVMSYSPAAGLVSTSRMRP